MTEEERRKVELDKITIETKMKKIDEREAQINLSEKDLRKKVSDFLEIFRVLARILIEHIGMKNSLNSKLQN